MTPANPDNSDSQRREGVKERQNPHEPTVPTRAHAAQSQLGERTHETTAHEPHRGSDTTRCNGHSPNGLGTVAIASIIPIQQRLPYRGARPPTRANHGPNRPAHAPGNPPAQQTATCRPGTRALAIACTIDKGNPQARPPQPGHPPHTHHLNHLPSPSTAIRSGKKPKEKTRVTAHMHNHQRQAMDIRTLHTTDMKLRAQERERRAWVPTGKRKLSDMCTLVSDDHTWARDPSDTYRTYIHTRGAGGEIGMSKVYPLFPEGHEKPMETPEMRERAGMDFRDEFGRWTGRRGHPLRAQGVAPSELPISLPHDPHGRRLLARDFTQQGRLDHELCEDNARASAMNKYLLAGLLDGHMPLIIVDRMSLAPIVPTHHSPCTRCASDSFKRNRLEPMGVNMENKLRTWITSKSQWRAVYVTGLYKAEMDKAELVELSHHSAFSAHIYDIQIPGDWYYEVEHLTCPNGAPTGVFERIPEDKFWQIVEPDLHQSTTHEIMNEGILEPKWRRHIETAKTQAQDWHSPPTKIPRCPFCHMDGSEHKLLEAWRDLPIPEKEAFLYNE